MERRSKNRQPPLEPEALASRARLDRTFPTVRGGGPGRPRSTIEIELARLLATEPGEGRAGRARGERDPGHPARAGTSTFARCLAGSRRWLRQRRKFLLPTLTTLLVAALAGVTWPHFAWRYRSYGAGTELETCDGYQPYGVVLDIERDHVFPNGARHDAYRIRVASSGEERWLSRDEVNRMACPR